MARIDSLLNLVDRQGANELRLGTDKEPSMFAQGTPKRLSIPKTSTETLRELLGELLGKDRERELVEKGRVEFLYESAELGPFRVTFSRRGGADALLLFDAVFLRGKGRAPLAEAAAPPAPAAPPRERPPERPLPSLPQTQPVAVAAEAVRPPSAPMVASPELLGLLRRAAALRASDVHLAAGEAPAVRIDGRLSGFGAEPAADLGALLGEGLLSAVTPRLDAGTSADIALALGPGRARMNVFRAANGLAASIRLLPGRAPTLAELDLPVPLESFVDLPHGLVLVCGATGSGKSTTLAALAGEALRRRSVMLVSLEDPIEYELTDEAPRSLVRQRQIGRDVRDFATGLRDALREDPDILIIGEMRDPETIGLALTAAETGHLVLASLHSRSAASAIERIIDTYAAERQQQIRVQLADSLRAVVAQRLIPRLSGEGRISALEVLRATHGVQSAIREGKTSTITSAMQSGKKDGMIPLERCLADLVQKRRISLEDARAAANDANALTAYLSGG